MPGRRGPARGIDLSRRRARGAAGPPAPDAAALDAARSHAALAAALDPILTIDAKGTIRSASDSVRRVFGWAPEELAGRNISVLMPEPYRSAHNAHLARYRRTGRTSILGRARRFEGVRKNGEVFPIEVSVARVARPPTAGPPWFVGIIRDISEQRRLENELRLVQDLALGISSASNLAAALVEAIRRIATATNWEYGEAWTPDSADDDLVPAAWWAQPGGGLDALGKSMLDLRLRRGEGLPGRAWTAESPIWVDDLRSLPDRELARGRAARAAGMRAAGVVPIPADGGTVALLLFFVRGQRGEDARLLDLVRTAVAPLGSVILRKRAEDALDEHRRRLQEQVEERTRDLRASQQKLRFADRLASIGTLAAGLGHDMNNVLLPVRAHLNALRAEPGTLPPHARRHLEAIRKSTAYLQQLADGLHFLAMDPDQEENPGEVTDLAAWWSQAGVLISRAVPRHVKVRASFPPDLPVVAIAPAGLTQAVLNLVVNAGEAIPAGRKRVQGSVRVIARADPGASVVRLSVTDNGKGMSEAVRRRAWDMFFTTKPRGMGTGLGLPLVRKVTEAAGGSVSIESQEGKGTTMTMTLPIATKPRPELDRGPAACVSIDDGRSAALVRLMLEASGARAAIGPRPNGADVWVVQPTPERLRDAAAWRTGAPHARLVLFGTPDAGSTGAWSELRPIPIERPDDFDAVRAALARAIAPA